MKKLIADLIVRIKSAFLSAPNMPNPVPYKISEGNSLFDFTKNCCLNENEDGLSNIAFHRLCSLMRKMEVEWAIVENIYRDNIHIKSECEALDIRLNKKVEVKAYKVTFIVGDIDDPSDAQKLKLIENLDDNNFLASAIVINYRRATKDPWSSYVFNSIVVFPQKASSKRGVPLLNNYYHVYRTFECFVATSNKTIKNYNIIGTYFCQQNGITSVCAHASLCMTLNNYLSDSSLLVPEDINNIIGINHIDKKFGNDVVEDEKASFTQEEIKKVLESKRLTYVLQDFFDDPNTEYNDAVYKYLESGCPVLLVFITDRVSHIVPILGHTLNTDLWRPEAEPAYAKPILKKNFRVDAMKSASAWVDHFIIHDDNFGMYFCLPVDALKRVTLPKYDPTFRAHYAVAIKPDIVTVSPREAEDASMNIVWDTLFWFLNKQYTLDEWTTRIVYRVASDRKVVVRTFLATKDEYRKSLNASDFKGDVFSDYEKEIMVNTLPDKFWLTEITLPELYTANKKKVIDFIYKCDCKEPLGDKNEINQRWIQIRFPYMLVKRNDDGSKSIHPVSIKSHYPLLKKERDHEVEEW